MFEVRTAGLKGLGVFATKSIARGTRIFSERPLLGLRYGQSQGDLYPAYRMLSPRDQEKISSLSAHATRETGLMRWAAVGWYTFRNMLRGRFLWRIGEHNRLLNIFRTNSFSLNAGSVFASAVFPSIARLNHACVPNSQGNFNDDGGVLNVHALRDIEAGVELTLSYLDDRGMLKEERGEELKSYGFECGCGICDVKSELGRESEKRREAMRKTIEGFAQNGDGKEEVEVLMNIIGLMREEEFAGREIAAMYFGAAKLYAAEGDRDKALLCAEKGLEIDERCLGRDHKTFRDDLTQVDKFRRAVQGENSCIDEHLSSTDAGSYGDTSQAKSELQYAT